MKAATSEAFQSLIDGGLVPSGGLNSVAVEAGRKVATLWLEASDRVIEEAGAGYRSIWREPISEFGQRLRTAADNCMSGATLCEGHRGDAGVGHDDGQVQWSEALDIALGFAEERPETSPDDLAAASFLLNSMVRHHIEAVRTLESASEIRSGLASALRPAERPV